MIFLDESGKRWKRIKQSATGVALLGTLPVLALVGGSLAYHPQWGILPLVQQAAETVLSGPATPEPVKADPPKPSFVSTNPATPRSFRPVISTSLTVAAALPAPPPTAAPVTAPQPTAAPAIAIPKAASPTNGDPVQNDHGQSHNPKPRP